MSPAIHHQPVMLSQSLALLGVQPKAWYVDATLGGGGHTQAILAEGGRVVGLDIDPVAIASVKRRLSSPHLTLVNDNFINLKDVVYRLGLDQVSGVIFDLGTSAFQLDDPLRGFSFQANAPLDMRMSPALAVTAADLVNGLSQRELVVLLTRYAQERRARALARAIVQARRSSPIRTTGELAALCETVYGGQRGKLHPATKVFQALRLAVNDELNALKQALPQALSVIRPGGRLVVISFHQGEDSIVKQFIKDHSQECLNLTKKPLVPTSAQKSQNPRSRSAKLRAAQKI